ncbi:XRE family transcriptional regulator [Fibrella forsythiae]|uniref:Helix-turn-helix domain-containing protein n=1 Tax=Fibrella forsythiae TaxID=2817061 RepID=A0ABS3JSE0_9BACT|nr:helix-turn-helix domain-containing protein [Fibrella forsythiae]MBO0952929.1 helix-turn-helix domain-containing protein [Fibrella forsythiae]
MTPLAQKIKELRKSNGLNQTQLAKKLGITPQSVSEWESGRTRPDISKLLELAHALDTTVDELVPSTTQSQGQSSNRIKRVMVDIGMSKKLPLISIKGQANVIENSLEGCQLKFIEDYYQLYIPGVDLDEDKHVIIEIEGDSMEPEIKNRAMVLGEHITTDNVRYESNGVYAVLYAHRFVVKRIKTNDITQKKQLILYSDNDRYGPMTVEATDIKCLWKISRIVDSLVY